MIPELGHFALILALFMAAAQALPALGRRAALLQSTLAVIALAALLWATVTLDFTVALVAEHAHTLKPFYRNIADVFTSPAGFGMLLFTVLSARGAMIAAKDFSPLLLRSFALMSLLVLALVLFAAAPFARAYPPPFDGVGYDPFKTETAPAAQASLIGGPLPAFKAAGLGTADIEAPAVINFFASWCLPCEAEHHVLQQIADSGVRVYGISYKDTPEGSAAFLERLGNPYIATGADPQGQAGAKLNIIGLPTTLAIDGEGIVRYRHDAPLTEEDAAALREALQ